MIYIPLPFWDKDIDIISGFGVGYGIWYYIGMKRYFTMTGKHESPSHKNCHNLYTVVCLVTRRIETAAATTLGQMKAAILRRLERESTGPSFSPWEVRIPLLTTWQSDVIDETGNTGFILQQIGRTKAVVGAVALHECWAKKFPYLRFSQKKS